MASKTKTAEVSAEIYVQDVEFGEVEFFLLGATPLVYNRMAEKARQQLLMPRPGRMTAGEKATSEKHDPLFEFRSSVYRYGKTDGAQPTRLKFPAAAFRRAVASATLDIPGVAKTQIARLVTVQHMDVPVWGDPKLFMSVVRSSDMKRTPDIRTRAILPRWATKVRFRYMRPNVTVETLTKLIVPAGVTIGIGDGRNEKGALSYGSFILVREDDKRWQQLQSEGTKSQDAALEAASCYDEESDELLRWFTQEQKTRGRKRVKSQEEPAEAEIHA